MMFIGITAGMAASYERTVAKIKVSLSEELFEAETADVDEELASNEMDFVHTEPPCKQHKPCRVSYKRRIGGACGMPAHSHRKVPDGLDYRRTVGGTRWRPRGSRLVNFVLCKECHVMKGGSR